MRLNELLKRLVKLPPDTDVVVDVGRIEIDVVDIVDLEYPSERRMIALSLHPEDLRDAFSAYRGSVDQAIR